MESLLVAGAVTLTHIGFVYLMSECLFLFIFYLFKFISIKFTRIYHLRGYFSKISWSPLDNTVALTLFLIKNKKTRSFAHITPPPPSWHGKRFMLRIFFAVTPVWIVSI